MAHNNTPIALTIAGSDPSGGAGLQADLKTFSALHVYGGAVVTALTAQNTRGVSNIWPVPAGSVEGQVRSVLEDVPVTAIKLGMLFSTEVIAEVAEVLADYPDIPVVCDPVMVATSGDRLLSIDAVMAMREWILPRAALITPNVPEAAVLLDSDPADDDRAVGDQAAALLDWGPGAVLLKGGHLTGERAGDLLVRSGEHGVESRWFTAPRVATRNTHGTGCTLASAIAAGLARGDSLEAAVGTAKHYISAAIAQADGIHVGAGAGPVNHLLTRQR